MKFIIKFLIKLLIALGLADLVRGKFDDLFGEEETTAAEDTTAAVEVEG